MILDRAHIEAALPGYQVSGLIGSGGFGLVFAGRHLGLGRPVAIKILLPGADGGVGLARATFAAEARLLERLAHPHIVRVHDYVERDDMCMIVMEHCDGGSLRARARAGLVLAEVVGVGLAVAGALHLAHRRQVIHRDIKPDNILFAADGTPKVTDFGIAKLIETAGDAANTVVGTPAYMAPEQFTGASLQPATDVYSLGAVLYELLSGRTPFPRRASPVHLAVAHLNQPPPPLPDPAPPEIAAVVLRALGKDPADRHRTAESFALDLAAATAHTLGPDWLERCPIPVDLAEQVRVAARGTAIPSPPVVPPAHLPPSPPSPLPAVSGPPETGPRARRDRGRYGAGRGWWPGRRRSADGAPRAAVDLRIDSPFGVAVAPDGALLISQPLRHRVSRIGPERLADLRRGPPGPGGAAADAAVVAGTGKAGRRGDGGPAAAAELDSPAGIAVTPDGTVLIADCLNDRLRRVGPDGRIDTVTGAADVRRPRSVAVDPAGVIYLADTGGHRVWRFDPRDGGSRPGSAGVPGRAARVVAGTGVRGFSGDQGPADRATLGRPQAVAVDDVGRLLIADPDHHRVRRVEADGRIDTVAGTPYGGRSAAAGGPARLTDIGAPNGLAVGADGVILLADTAHNQVIAVDAGGAVRVLASVSGPVTVMDPRQVAVGPDGAVYVAQPSRHRITIIPPSAR